MIEIIAFTVVIMVMVIGTETRYMALEKKFKNLSNTLDSEVKNNERMWKDSKLMMKILKDNFSITELNEMFREERKRMDEGENKDDEK